MPPLLMATSPKGPGEQGNQNQLERRLDSDHIPGITQHIPITPGPPQVDPYAHVIPVCVLPHPFSLCARTAFLTVPLAGSAQSPPPQSRSSS